MLPIPKTPKCYVGGAFIRSESGRVEAICRSDHSFFAHIPQCSRKDLRNAVEAAAKGLASWSPRSPYNRAQILYRIAEMLEARTSEMALAIDLSTSESPSPTALTEVRTTIDRIVHFAGWADKFEQVLGSVNPVATPHFNFTVSEPMGAIGIIAPTTTPLLGLVTLILHAVTSGNSVVALASETSPYPAILLGEILAVSDLPPGVVNLLTGKVSELLPTFATHEHLRAVSACLNPENAAKLRADAAASIKRTQIHDISTDWFDSSHESPYALRNFIEAKTVWHPIGA